MRNRRLLRSSIDKFSDVVGMEYDERSVPRPKLPKDGDGYVGVEADGDADLCRVVR